MRFAMHFSEPARVAFNIFNLSGERVAEVNATLPMGQGQSVAWDCRGASPGIYLARVVLAGEEIGCVKVAVLKP